MERADGDRAEAAGEDSVVPTETRDLREHAAAAAVAVGGREKRATDPEDPEAVGTAVGGGALGGWGKEPTPPSQVAQLTRRRTTPGSEGSKEKTAATPAGSSAALVPADLPTARPSAPGSPPETEHVAIDLNGRAGAPPGTGSGPGDGDDDDGGGIPLEPSAALKQGDGSGRRVVIVPSFSAELLKNRKPGERKPFHQKIFKTPKETAVAVEAISTYKAELRLDRLIILGFVAGVFVGFGGLFGFAVVGGMPLTQPGMQKLIFALCFETALIFIVLFGADLFTGDTMYMSLGMLTRTVTWQDAGRVLVTSYFANYAGAVFAAVFFGYFTEIFEESPWADYVVHVTLVKCSLPPQVVFLKAIGCNWLVCLGVWMALSAESVEGKILACIVPITCFAAIGFEHCVANMFYSTLGLMVSASTGIPCYCNIGMFIYKNLILVTLGNIVGGVLFMSVVIWWTFLEGRRVPAPKDV